MGKYYLGIDIGTFETKGVLVDDCFRVAAVMGAKHGMENPHPNFLSTMPKKYGGKISVPFLKD